MAEEIRLAVVPVAGLGTRMLPLTRSIPKEMLPVGRKLCIEHIVDELVACGIEEIIFVVSEGKEKIAAHFEMDATLDQRLRSVGKHDLADQLQKDAVGERLTIKTVHQSEQKGLGHAIWCAREVIDDRPFVIALGDSMIQTRQGNGVLQRMCDVFADPSTDIVVAFQHVAQEHVVKYGIAIPSNAEPLEADTEKFDLAGLVEKPARESAPSQWAVSARYILAPSILPELESTASGTGGEIQLTDAIHAMIQAGTRGQAVCLSESEKRIDIGSIPGYLAAFVEMALSDPDLGDDICAQLIEQLNEAVNG